MRILPYLNSYFMGWSVKDILIIVHFSSALKINMPPVYISQYQSGK